MNSGPRSLPFVAKVSLPDTLREARIHMAIKGKDPVAKLEETDKAFSQFAVAAQCGMFAAERVSPTQSHFQIVACEREAARIQYDCKVVGIDLGAFRILLNVVAESCRDLEPLEEVRLTGVSPVSNEWGLEAVLRSPFPRRMREVPFELNLKEFFFENPEPLVRIEFQSELTDQQFDSIKPMIGAWDTIMMLGGYLETPTGRDPPLAEQDQLFELFLAEPTVLEHLIYAFEGPEETFNGVINAAVKIHSTICPLASLEIE